jgi:hypothetical protein
MNRKEKSTRRGKPGTLPQVRASIALCRTCAIYFAGVTNCLNLFLARPH